jgi:hypothetical protein
MGEEIEKDYLEEKNRERRLVFGKDENVEGSTSSSPNVLKENKSPKFFEPIEFDFKIKLKIIFIQNLGIIFGFSFMLIMAFVADNINLS